jgi:glycosyltransferase involved in cell wall biosynthesis
MPHVAELRVLHVASGDLWGGAESQIHALLRELVRQPGVQVSAALMNPGELATRLQSLGIPVFVLDERRQGTFTLFRRLAGIVRKARPHIVHTHRQKENVLGSVAAAGTSAVSMRTVHGAPEFALSGRQIHKQLFRSLNRLTAKHLQVASVAVSTELASRLPVLLPGSKIEMIDNGLDVNALRASASIGSAAPSSTVKVCFIGRLVSVKRLDVFVRMAAVLERRSPGQYEFHILGDGPLRAQTEALVRELNVERMCRFHGFTNDVPKHLAGMDMLVLTSDHEGLPMTALEALALGVPVVAHAVGGLPELLSTPGTGALVSSQDPEKFADAVETTRRAEGDHRTRSLLLPRYQIENTAARYLELYRRLARA